MIGTLRAASGKLLILINGAYGKRMVAHLRLCRPRPCRRSRWPEDRPVDPAARRARRSPATPRSPTSPSSTARPPRACSTRSPRSPRSSPRAGRRLLIDCHERLRRPAARRPRDRRSMRVAASSNKCLEGVPGLGFVICREAALEAGQGQRPFALASISTISGRRMEKTGQWRFTPPTHVHRRLRAGARASTRPRAASPAAAPAIATTAASWSRACARSASRPCCPTRCRRRSSSPSACRPIRASSLRGLLRPAARARLRHLSGQADRRRQLPHRLHRPARRARDARRARRRERGDGRDGRHRAARRRR